jgi:hypothetical protein
VTSTGDLRVAITGGGGGGTEFNEDTPHVSGDKGTQLLAVRRDAKTSLVDANGDYAPVQVDANGALIVTGQGALFGPTEYTTDDPLPTTPTGPHVQTRRSSVLSTTAPADDDSQGLRTSSRGALWVAIDQIGAPVGDATIGRAFLNVTANGTQQTIVAAVAGKRIRVHQVAAVAGAATADITFRNVTAATAISPLFANDVRGGEVLPFSQMGWFETAVGDGLAVLPSTAASPVGVLVGYSLV